MMRILTATTALTILAQPAFAASGPFFSLRNTDFVVLLAFLLFIGILLYFKVPGMLTKMLDDRAVAIRAELDEAKALREEAQTLLASYERKQKEVQEQAERLVTNAQAEAERAAEQAKVDIRETVARRLEGAREQLDNARAAAEKEVRDTAVNAAVAAARSVIAKNMSATDANKLIDASIAEVGAKLH